MGLVGASNLSTAIIILGIGVILIFVASPKYAQFAMMGIAGACFMGIFLALESYRLERLAIWRNPENMKRVIRPCRGFTRLDPEEYSESGSETVYRSWDLYLRHRMI